MSVYLGDYAEDANLYFKWSTNDSDGASITRATNGTVRVYKDSDATGTVTGVTDMEDWQGHTGIHECAIDLSTDAYYATGSDYIVLLQSATIDGQTVNAVLAHFSIEHRFNEVDVTKLGGAAQSATDLKDFADAGYDPATNKVQGVVLVDTTTTNTDMVGTDSAALASVCTETRLQALTDWLNGGRLDLLLDAIKAVTDLLPDAGALTTIGTDTARLTAVRAAVLTDWINGGRLDLLLDQVISDIAALNDLSAANVNAEVVDALATDTYAEPGQGAPAATASITTKLGYLYKFLRNKIVQDATTLEVYNDAGAVVDQKATVSDDGTDFTRGEIGSGP